MAKVRKIKRSPDSGRNYYLVDANFLVNKHLSAASVPTEHEAARIKACRAWWQEIDAQLDAGCARVFVPDVCIAEAFKALADKHYRLHWFPRHADFATARNRLSQNIRTNEDPEAVRKDCALPRSIDEPGHHHRRRPLL